MNSTEGGENGRDQRPRRHDRGGESHAHGHDGRGHDPRRDLPGVLRDGSREWPHLRRVA